MPTPTDPPALTEIPAPTPPASAVTVEPSVAGPVAEQSRLIALDTCRGIALLGIFFVNASLFGLPFAAAADPSGPTDESTLSQGVYWFTAVCCSGKFYPLFSLLFGVGLAIMVESSARAGRRFAIVFLRRLLMLAAFGAAHIFLLWSGDILLIYGVVGLCMLGLGRRSAPTLLYVALGVFVLGVLFSAGFAVLLQLGESAAGEAAVPVRPDSPAIEQWLHIARSSPEGAADTRLADLETYIMTHGPFRSAAALRLWHYAYGLYWVIAVAGCQILACFCAGAALLKLGFFHGRLAWLRRVFIAGGLLIGLPLNVLYGWGSQQGGSLGWSVMAQVGMQAGGPLMSLMYLSFVMTWTDSKRLAPVAGALAQLGRMGLSGYLLESVLMCGVMLHWGLARFGQDSWAGRAGFVLAIYVTILALSNVWMRLFRMGPLEWLWRSWTYWTWQTIGRS